MTIPLPHHPTIITFKSPTVYSREEMEAFRKFLKEQEIKSRAMVHIDINAMDPLDPCHLHSDTRDLQVDVTREREQDGDVRYYGIGE